MILEVMSDNICKTDHQNTASHCEQPLLHHHAAPPVTCTGWMSSSVPSSPDQNDGEQKNASSAGPQQSPEAGTKPRTMHKNIAHNTISDIKYHLDRTVPEGDRDHKPSVCNKCVDYILV